MSFLAPGFLVAAGAAALVIVGLHFLSTRDPKLELLPTTRFLPDLPVSATATTLRPTDPWLLLLRLLLVLLIGGALARPVLTPPREPVARIVAVDVSRAVADATELADSAERYLPGAAAVILFDSATYESDDAAEGVRIASDRLRSLAGVAGDGTELRGSLSASLVAARRAAARVRDRADSLELVVVSPFVAEEYDAATERIRELWPGRITAVRVTATVANERQDSIRIEWADSVTSSGTARRSAPSRYWTAREPADTVAAVRAGDAVLVYPFVRRWDIAAPDAGDTRVIARWADGEPAGIERTLRGSIGGRPAGAGPTACMRSFGFSLPAEGDALLRPEFQRFLASLAAPCGPPRDFTPLPASVMASLAGERPLAATGAIERRVERATPLMPWLLLAGVLIAVIEMVVRRRGRLAMPTRGSGRVSHESRARAS